MYRVIAEVNSIEEFRDLLIKLTEKKDRLVLNAIDRSNRLRVRDDYLIHNEDRSRINIVKCNWKDFYLDHRLKELLARESMETIKRLSEGKSFPTLINGVALQVMLWRISWQPLGGGTVGGENYFWLINNASPIGYDVPR